MGVDGSFFQSYCCLSDHNPAAAAKKGHKASKCSYLGLQSGKKRRRRRKKKNRTKKPGRSSAGFLSPQKAGADFHTEQGDWNRSLWLCCSGVWVTKLEPGELWGHRAECASPFLLSILLLPHPCSASCSLPIPIPRDRPSSSFQPFLHFSDRCYPSPQGCSPHFVLAVALRVQCPWCPCAVSCSGCFTSGFSGW